jgi:hypothetical protein
MLHLMLPKAREARAEGNIKRLQYNITPDVMTGGEVGSQNSSSAHSG